ncbi:MAG: AAA family ATPase [Caldilineaceae bacterium]
MTAQAQFQARQQAVDDLQFELGQRQAERKPKLQDALDAARHRLTQLQNRQADRQSRLNQLAERRSTLHGEQQAQTAARTQAEAEAATIAAELATAQNALATEENQAAALQQEISRLEATAAELRDQLKQAEGVRQAADRTVDQLQTRHDLLTRLRNEGAGYASGVRAVLQAGERARTAQAGDALTGILGTVATLVQVPPQLDQAIETALGGAFQNVVTESWDDAREAIELLKRTGQGRATFLPLDRLSVLPAIDAPNAPGILGNAADLVTYDSKVADVALSLLGRTWVAEDLPAARRALDRLGNGPRPTVVTLGGEIVRPGGAVTGGRDSNRRDDSVLAREREYRELPQQIEQARQKSTRAAAACHELTVQIEKGSLLMEQSRQMLAELARQERQRREQAAETQRRLDRAQQAARWQQERLQQSTAELARMDEQEQEYNQALAQIQTERAAAETELAAAEASVEAAGASELLQQLADLRAAAAEAQGHLRSQQALRENQQRTLQSTTDQIRNKEQRIVELTGEAETLQVRIAQLDAQEAELSQQIAVYQEKIDPAQAQLDQLETAQSDEESRERELQQALRANETAWNNAQLQLQRTEDTLTQLRYDIEHDFGLVELEQGADMAYQPPLPLESTVEHLPVVESVPDGLEEEVKEMRARLSRVSNVNPDAPREYAEAAERFEFLSSESKDLQAAAADLRTVIKELDELMEVELRKMFQAVAVQFEHFFGLLFNGGTAKLVLTTPEDINNTGVEIIARPPGKRPQSLALLSGGERALSACALIFAILQVSPTPFCVLDEVDAALDEANVDRFRQTVETLTGATQFIIVTHNRRTLEGANTIYGVTMGDDGISKTISLRLEGDKIVQNAGDESPDDVKVVEELIQM